MTPKIYIPTSRTSFITLPSSCGNKIALSFMDDMSSKYARSGYNALYSYISCRKKSKKIIEFSSGDSHMVTTHCITDQAIRCLFTAERTGCKTFIMLWLN